MIIAIFNPYYIVFRFKCIKELERIYGIRQGSANEKGVNQHINGQSDNLTHQKTQEELAKQINIYF